MRRRLCGTCADARAHAPRSTQASCAAAWRSSLTGQTALWEAPAAGRAPASTPRCAASSTSSHTAAPGRLAVGCREHAASMRRRIRVVNRQRPARCRAAAQAAGQAAHAATARRSTAAAGRRPGAPSHQETPPQRRLVVASTLGCAPASLAAAAASSVYTMSRGLAATSGSPPSWQRQQHQDSWRRQREQGVLLQTPRGTSGPLLSPCELAGIRCR